MEHAPDRHDYGQEPSARSPVKDPVCGVLVKNAEALERMEKVDTLVVDKTGTLTDGRPPIIAAAAMALSSVSVVTNALRLNRVTL